MPTLRNSGDPSCNFVNDQAGVPLDAAAVAEFLETLARDQAPGMEFSVAVVEDDQVRSSNRAYRKIDRVTDVLAFPDGEGDYLGDIVIAGGRAARQAAEHGHSVEQEVQVLALHGLLHLKGFDHESDSGEMSAEESRLREFYSLPSALISRSSRNRGRSSGDAPTHARAESTRARRGGNPS